MLLEFIKQFPKGVEKYSSSERTWPLIFDEFVGHMNGEEEEEEDDDL